MSLDHLMAMRSVVSGEAPRWRPDGSLIAFPSSMGGSMDLWGVSPEGGGPFRLATDLGPMPFMAGRFLSWAPDGRRFAYLSARSGSTEVWLCHPASGQHRQLTRLGAHINSLCWSRDGGELYFAGNRNGNYQIYGVPVASGAVRQLTRSRLNEVYPAAMPDGSGLLYVRLSEDWTEHEVLFVGWEGESRLVVRDTGMFDYFYGRAFGQPLITPDGRWLLFRSHRSGWLNYWRAPLAGGKPELLAPAPADQGEGVLSPDGRYLAYVENHGGTLCLKMVPVAGGEAVTLHHPGMGVCSAPQWSPDGSRISFLLERPTEPAELYLLETGSGALRRLTRSVGTGAGEQTVSPEKLVYAGHEGLEIQAYLYRPPAIREGAKFPAIVYVHGGPASQWLDSFQLIAQFFVSRGYVVLMPNIRGSTGYGKAFMELNRQDWCGKDLLDAVAGAEYLRSLPYVEPGAVGITGNSYGGILSMCAVTFTPDAFQAAIPMGGYCDWVFTYHEQELRHIKYLEHALGPFPENEAVYRRCSAIRAVSQAKAPCLIIHGEGQPPQTKNSWLFAKELERHYKTFAYKTYPGEGYYVLSPGNVRQMLLDMGAWFDLYLKERVG